MGTSRTCMIFITILSVVTAEDFDKRAPQGFLGMRGKKYFEENTDQFYKRKPQFFVGVKGKKSLTDILQLSEDYYKRAPTGFMGMRGKKDTDSSFFNHEYVPKRDGSLIGQIDYSSNENIDLPMLNDILYSYLRKLEQLRQSPDSLDMIPEMTNEVEKRAANMHQFYGVRGKKSLNNKRPYDLTFRGKFIGVRGKRDMKSEEEQAIKFLLDTPLPKRKSQMGFLGMRGKKWADESSIETENAPN